MKYKYEIVDADAAMITEVTEPQEEIVFPGVIDGHNVVAIGSDVIPEDKSKVLRIKLPGSVRALHDEAFLDLHYLKSLELNEGLMVLGDRAIYTCPDLLELYVPASVKVMGDHSVGFMYEHGRSYRLRYFVMVCQADTAASRFAEAGEIKCRICQNKGEAH
jgi:hypothetical protein